jgi:chromosomal replication initiator protein
MNALSTKRFVIGESNRVAINAGVTLGTAEDCAFEALLIQGPGGSGKTHLLRTIETMHRTAHPEAKRKFVNAGEMMRWPVDDYEAELLDVDLLLIDDVDLVARHKTAGETLSLVMDTVQRLALGRIAMTTTYAMRDLAMHPSVGTRLLSRLHGAAGADMDRPNIEMRADMIRSTLEAWPDLNIGEAIIDSMALALPPDGHVITGAARRVALHAITTGEAPLREDVMRMLASSISIMPTIAIATIQERTAAHFHIRESEMRSARRGREVARPRQVAMYLSKHLTPKSLPDIGRRFGNRDHTTVIHAVRTIDRLRSTDPELDADVRIIERQLTH